MSNQQSQSPVNTQPDNPFFDKLNPQQIEASIKFYEADHALTGEDRVKLSKDLQNLLGKANITSLGAAIVGSASPTIYHRFIKRQVPAGAKMIVYPGWSFLLGITNMLVVHSVYGRSQFVKAQQGEHDNVRIKQVWQSMDYRTLAFFYIYYMRSSMDPNAIMKDPRTITRSDIYGVKVDDRLKEKVDEEHATRWNEIRQEEPVSEYTPRTSAAHEEEDDIFGFNKPENSDTNEYQSAWDKIRSNSK
ncbi:hypothetical protein JA1_004295 [Spathaspora sp. JA1]|nr:hypothetical protein JA1_004295 [Spathaspora sp. JA1]